MEAGKELTMDVSRYMAKGFIKPDDVRVPREERIINVYESDRYDCLVLDFESGDQLSLNPITTRVLGKAYNTESNYWIGQLIELSCGTYKNKDNETKETVVVKPISPPKHGGNGMPPAKPSSPQSPPSGRGDMDDEIPF
jgi:hypothetical protein